MDKRPNVSVIVPIYNVEKYLDRCMHSLVNQTLKDIEIILIDDGSIDNCPQMCDKYASQDSRIKVIHKKNAGLGYARNSGLEVATGEYVAFLDSDDFIDERMYEILYDKAKNNNLDAVFCGCYFYTSPSLTIKRSEVLQDTIYMSKNSINKILFDFIAPLPEYPNDVKYMMSVWHALYSLDIIHKNSITFCSEREYLSEDILFNIDYLSVTQRICFIPDPLYYYCSNEGSLSRTYNKEKYERAKKLIIALDLRLKKKYSRDEYIIHLQRFQLFYLRLFFIGAIKRKKIKLAKDIIKDSFWADTLNRYPIRKLCTSKMLFYNILRILNLICKI